MINVHFVDDIEHYFIECEYVQYFWRAFSNWWSDTTEVGFQLQTQEKLFGVLNLDNDELLNVLNYMLIFIKWYFTSVNQIR